jgi:molecular chaperone IbpA
VDGAIKTGNTTRTYLHRGIGTRNFSHKFVLNEFVEVKSADIVDGLLVISLENVIPEEKKSRKINIGK